MAFHPDFKMMDKPPTPPETLLRAQRIAQDLGLNYVYVGNVHDLEHSSTYCPSAKKCILECDWYECGAYKIYNGSCLLWLYHSRPLP